MKNFYVSLRQYFCCPVLLLTAFAVSARMCLAQEQKTSANDTAISADSNNVKRFDTLYLFPTGENVLLDENFNQIPFMLNKGNTWFVIPYHLSDYNWRFPSDKICVYNEKPFFELLSLEYKKSISYDLGIISGYLKMSKTIAAIILAVISAAKYY